MKQILGREPALVFAAINALIMVLGTLGLNLFNSDQAGLLVAVINALAGVLTAMVTRPIGPGAFTALIAALIALLGAYQINLPGPTVAAINAAVYPLLAFLTRGNVSPIDSPVTELTAAPTPEAFAHSVKDGQAAVTEQ